MNKTLVFTTTLMSSVSLFSAEARKPNVVIIFADDLGYTDLGCYGAKKIKTPTLDKLAKNGVKLTQCYAAQPVSSPSRAGLLTGRYPQFVGLGGPALWIDAKKGLLEETITLPEMLKAAGYSTGIVGKWHLGHLPKYLPTKHGFDFFEGIPYSNSMWSLRDDGLNVKFPKLPYYKDLEIVDYIDSWDKMNNLTDRITKTAINYINENKDSPFFLYIAHPMPHVPLGVSEKYKGKSGIGLYGDVLLEIDDSTQRIIGALEKNKIQNDTIIIFTSDNGPWLNYGNHAGTCDKLREGKGTSFEGGFRIPCIVSYPKKIPREIVSNELVSLIDIYPTLAKFCGAKLPKDKIDGIDLSDFLTQKSKKSPRENFFFFYGSNGQQLQALTDGKYKLIFPHSYNSFEKEKPKNDGKAGRTVPTKSDFALYNLDLDIGERNNIIKENMQIAEKFKKITKPTK